MPLYPVTHKGGSADQRTLEIPESWSAWFVGRDGYYRVSRGAAVHVPERVDLPRRSAA